MSLFGCLSAILAELMLSRSMFCVEVEGATGPANHADVGKATWGVSGRVAIRSRQHYRYLSKIVPYRGVKWFIGGFGRVQRRLHVNGFYHNSLLRSLTETCYK
ncbi:hypothetical protein EJ02DRAFT_459321 [Clathrospora elynae]|uniref:Secreted protein n=1 Tax=Clathrospora elynae TaxID=706981 RepID=A0A6A5SAN1_9PLEO|nr:hypothetical protein EJ02DRAFT_459321 [Clathrospora elynae]